jgi:hypothetical protein
VGKINKEGLYWLHRKEENTAENTQKFLQQIEPAFNQQYNPAKKRLYNPTTYNLYDTIPYNLYDPL